MMWMLWLFSSVSEMWRRKLSMNTLLSHKEDLDLTYDNLLFLINRIEMMDSELIAMEPENAKHMLDDFLNCF